jgi:hypothetical protein
MHENCAMDPRTSSHRILSSPAAYRTFARHLEPVFAEGTGISGHRKSCGMSSWLAHSGFPEQAKLGIPFLLNRNTMDSRLGDAIGCL